MSFYGFLQLLSSISIRQISSIQEDSGMKLFRINTLTNNVGIVGANVRGPQLRLQGKYSARSGHRSGGIQSIRYRDHPLIRKMGSRYSRFAQRSELFPEGVSLIVLVPLLGRKPPFVVLWNGRAREDDRPLLHRAKLMEVPTE